MPERAKLVVLKVDGRGRGWIQFTREATLLQQRAQKADKQRLAELWMAVPDGALAQCIPKILRNDRNGARGACRAGGCGRSQAPRARKAHWLADDDPLLAILAQEGVPAPGGRGPGAFHPAGEAEGAVFEA